MSRLIVFSRESILILMTLTLLVIAIMLPAIPQDADYHKFADQREILGLNYFSDVISNSLYLVAGIWGLVKLKYNRINLPRSWQFFANIFFIGFILTFLGSSWYHLHPDNPRLVIDRLGMSIIFSGLLGLSACERVGIRAGFALFITFLSGCVASLWIWVVTTNLSPWIVIQVGGMILVLWLASLKPEQTKINLLPHTSLSFIILWYALAKVCEFSDHSLFTYTDSIISGHTLKHLLSAFAAIPVIHAINKFNKIRL